MGGKEVLRSMGNGERHSKKGGDCMVQEEMCKGFRTEDRLEVTKTVWKQQLKPNIVHINKNLQI